jgi:Kef-type K+ transport system membrane component KefB
LDLEDVRPAGMGQDNRLHDREFTRAVSAGRDDVAMSTAVSLFWIAVCAVAAPLIAGLVPRKLLPEVVLLLGFGVLIGPHGIQLATATEGVEVLSDLGLAMLFLLAGYEINLKELTGRGGRRALVTWLICIAIAGGLVYLLGTFEAINAEAAIAIVLTSTALGTLLPILKEQGLVHTRFGRAILNHGAVGELSPVLAMALLLGTRGALGSILALVIFARRRGSRPRVGTGRPTGRAPPIDHVRF